MDFVHPKSRAHMSRAGAAGKQAESEQPMVEEGPVMEIAETEGAESARARENTERMTEETVRTKEETRRTNEQTERIKEATDKMKEAKSDFEEEAEWEDVGNAQVGEEGEVVEGREEHGLDTEDVAKEATTTEETQIATVGDGEDVAATTDNATYLAGEPGVEEKSVKPSQDLDADAMIPWAESMMKRIQILADEKMKQVDEKMKQADEKMKQVDGKMKQADEKMRQVDEKCR